MSAVAVEGTSGEWVRTPSPGTENGISTGSTERQHPKADSSGSDGAGGHSKAIGAGSCPNKDEGAVNHDQRQESLPNGVPGAARENVQAGAEGKRPECASSFDGVQMRQHSSTNPGGSRSRPMSFRLRSQHGLLLTEEMKVEGERMVVRLGEDSIAWESAKIGKGEWCVCALAVCCVSRLLSGIGWVVVLFTVEAVPTRWHVSLAVHVYAVYGCVQVAPPCTCVCAVRESPYALCNECIMYPNSSIMAQLSLFHYVVYRLLCHCPHSGPWRRLLMYNTFKYTCTYMDHCSIPSYGERT